LNPPIFHLLAGPNGAGKSTLYKALVAQGIVGSGCEFVNADLYEQAHLQHISHAQERSEAARAWADARRNTLLAQRRSFASETVFSHPSKLQLIAQAQQAGFVVALYIVAVGDPQQLVQRVARRVREGGHPVPTDKILSRYPRTLAHLHQAVKLADVAYIYDAPEVNASGTEGGQTLQAVCEDGRLAHQLVERLPQWVQVLLRP
jgi:predicted ABC-type ATPase